MQETNIMFAVIQDDEVIDYFKTKEEAEYEAFNQFELGYTKNIYVVQIISKYD